MKDKVGEVVVLGQGRGRKKRGEGGGGVSSLQSDLFAKSGHNESIMSPLIRECVWGPTNWA